MITEILRDSQGGFARAGEILRAGGLVAIPTETVYGLAANALDPEAVKGIFKAKGRPGDNPLIVHITEVSQWAPLVSSLPGRALKLAERYWPGPLTIILPKSPLVPYETSGGLDTVAVRCPSHPAARAVINAAGVPLAAPSANISGRPSPTTFAHTYEDLSGLVDAVLDGGDCQVGVESTVVSLCGDVPRLLRPGGVTEGQLRSVLGELEVDPAVIGELKPGEPARSPGMKYKHYAPRARIEVIDGSPEEYIEYVNSLGETQGTYALCFDETAAEVKMSALAYGPRYDRETQARRLFCALHRLDELGAKRALAQLPGRTGVGLAVYNRLARAAGFCIEKLPGPMIVGLVGPSGAGKSTVAAELVNRGFQLIDCDGLTRRDDVYDADCIEKLCRAFGPEVAPMGKLDRRELAARAFRDPEGVELLGEITFPPIVRAVRRELKSLKDSGLSGPMLLDAPTLFEAGLDRMCRRILAVTAPEAIRLRRVLERDGLTRERALERFRSQQPEGYYAARADYIVDNGGGTLEPQIERICAELKGAVG